MTVGDNALELARHYRDLLRGSGVVPEHLARYEPPKRRLLRQRPARLVPAARVWRLGVLLLTEDAELLAAGSTLRAHEPPAILGYTSASARWRDELRHMAIRGGFVEGTTVHYDAQQLSLAVIDEGTVPVSLREGELVVRWAKNTSLTSAIPLSNYLRERADLLVNPPQGAT